MTQINDFFKSRSKIFNLYKFRELIKNTPILIIKRYFIFLFTKFYTPNNKNKTIFCNY